MTISPLTHKSNVTLIETMSVDSIVKNWKEFSAYAASGKSMQEELLALVDEGMIPYGCHLSADDIHHFGFR